jgi:hypothetical protein
MEDKKKLREKKPTATGINEKGYPEVTRKLCVVVEARPSLSTMYLERATPRASQIR